MCTAVALIQYLSSEFAFGSLRDALANPPPPPKKKRKKKNEIYFIYIILSEPKTTSVEKEFLVVLPQL